ncbi:oxidoreductase, partial [Mycolicibacterium komossense]|nr:oxidoreductase [Mycolicibacterium komossense]
MTTYKLGKFTVHRIHHVVTAQFYGPDLANQLIREALHTYADDLALVSK